MNAINGVVKDRQILVPAPAEWPVGGEVVIELLASHEPREMTGEKSETPEEIAEWLRWYDSLEPLEFIPEEETDLAAWRLKVKEHTVANMDKRIEGLFE